MGRMFVGDYERAAKPPFLAKLRNVAAIGRMRLVSVAIAIRGIFSIK